MTERAGTKSPNDQRYMLGGDRSLRGLGSVNFSTYLLPVFIIAASIAGKSSILSMGRVFRDVSGKIDNWLRDDESSRGWKDDLCHSVRGDYHANSQFRESWK